MTDLYPLGHHGSDRWSTTSSHENTPSITVLCEPDPSSETLLHNDAQDRSQARGDRTLCYWCYGLHAFLVAVHVALVGMLFTHPEHSFLVSINNTGVTVALRVFLQAFYTIYTAVLVFMTQRLALSALMAQRQKLTAIHDITGAWNGIGAAISALWQQTKVTSSLSALLSIFIYFSCISGLHIISSTVIQFEAFNNSVTSVIPSSLAWTSASMNLSTIQWESISPLMAMWPLLPTAEGLSGSTLYDVPSPGYVYTEAVVNATTISADCGLLSNLSTGTWNSTTAVYHVDVNGLGEVDLPVQVLVNTVSFITFDSLSPHFCSICPNYIGYQITTALELGDQTTSSEVLQVDLEGPPGTTFDGSHPNFNVSTTSHFVACTLSATTTSLHLSMQDGQITNPDLLPNNSKEAESWAVWFPGNTTELVQMFNHAQGGGVGYSCQGLQFPAGYEECTFMPFPDIYTNSLLDIPWISSLNSDSIIATMPASPIILEKNDMESAIAQTAAAFIWLAGAAGVDDGGFQQDQGESLISYDILELRLNVNIAPVVVGLFISLMLLAIVAWMFHHSKPTYSKASITSPDTLGLIWISARSTSLQDFMKANNPLSDQLRIMGMKADVCLADMKSESIGLHGSTDYSLHLDSQTLAHDWQKYISKGQFFMHWLCYGLHAILLALHVILILLLIKHPEHNVTMASDNPWVTIALAISLQAFYVLYTAGLVFITQQLAISAVIAQRHYLTAVHDIAQAWTGIGAAVQALWQQTKVASSAWTMIGVVSYLACVSTLHIASTTIMQFTAFNSSSIITIQSAMAFSNDVDGTWEATFQGIPPGSLLSNIQTIGLLNNTLYDILTTTDPSFMNATVNATSLQANCMLLSNLTFYNSGPSLSLNFSVNGFGSGSYVLYGDVSHSAINLTVNIAQDDDDPIMAYLAACNLTSQTINATLDLQAGTLIPSPLQTSSQSSSWELWAPGIEGSPSLGSLASTILSNDAFAICPQNGFAGCSMNGNATLSAANSPLYILTPNQLQMAIEDSIAGTIWTAGQLGSNQGGFDRMPGESQVTQVITKWRLNINTVPVAFASMASLILFLLVLCLIRIPSRLPQHGSAITGLSVLETLWAAAYSQTLREHMADVNDQSLDHLRRIAMFKVCLGNIRGSQSDEAESDTFLE